ncbi:MAG: hypothetical protein ACRD1U_09905 [Vicinamibacterales bacterium]
MLLLLFRHIQVTLPYPYHADEGFISGPASNVLVKGELHPQRFNYPSLPTYLAATSMAFGFLRGATHLEIRDVSQIGHVGYPYYETPRIMQTARQTFALLSVVCIGLTGYSAWMAFRQPAAILLAPLILLASPLYFHQSWVYLNVDIVGTSVAMMTVAACLSGMARPSIARLAIVPGIFAGLATGSKYTLAIAILPVLAAIGFYMPRGRRVPGCLAAIAAMILAFLAVVPYSLVDIPGFLNGVGYEVFHYASGHAGNAGDPGWPQLVFYMRHFVTEFGYVAVIVSMLGLVAFWAADWRRTIVVALLPGALLWMLVGQRVHFTRNALPIQPFLAMFAAYGIVTIHAWIVNRAAARGWTWQRISVPTLAGVLLFVAAVPFWRFADHVRDRTDSRNQARAWIAENIPRNWSIVVPRELGLDGRGLDARGRHVKVVELKSVRDAGTVDAILGDVPAPAVMLVPRWGADRRSPGQSTADALNALTRQWRVIKTFGTNDVLVNYLFATAWGDPAFAVAVVK